MAAIDRTLLERALAGDVGALRTLVDELTPVIQVRVARALARSSVGTRGNRSVRQELEDLTQEVFVALLADDGRALRAWDPTRGLSLPNFVGLLAQRQVASILRSGKRSPWTEDPADLAELETGAGSEDSALRLESREMLSLLLQRVREELSPRGLELFHRICVEQESVESIVSTTGMSPDAVYAWRSRLRRLVVRIAGEMSEMSSSDRMPTPDAGR